MTDTSGEIDMLSSQVSLIQRTFFFRKQKQLKKTEKNIWFRFATMLNGIGPHLNNSHCVSAKQAGIRL